MPEIEEFGAQPPIELLRQLVDSEGYYDLKDKRWVSVIDVVVTCAMGPPGGGRNEITPRFLRHFSTLCFNEFDDATLSRIFNAIVDQSFSSRGEDFNRLSHAVVDSTLQIYREATRSLLPTPSKSQ